MKTFHRLALLAVALGAAACSSPTTAVNEAHTAGVQPSFDNGTTADSSASRGGGNLMGGN